MTDVLYQWPTAARVGIRVAKDKFASAGTASGGVRERFTSEVARITWAFKLAQSTVNLPGSDAVPEIQVFSVMAKADDVSDKVLAAIDRAIPYPIIFEITSGDATRLRMTCVHKQLTSSRPKLSSYYSTGWFPAHTTRIALPVAVTLDALYVALLQPLVPVALQIGDDPATTAERLQLVAKLERDIAALAAKIRNEPQLNRKVELRRTLKSRQADLESQR